jgi:hypothetical protein
MKAIDLPAEQRPRFIKRAVTVIRREFERKYVTDPDLGEAADSLQALVETMVKQIKESGGSVGHA